MAFLGYNDFPPRSFAAGPATAGHRLAGREGRASRDIKLRARAGRPRAPLPALGRGARARARRPSRRPWPAGSSTPAPTPSSAATRTSRRRVEWHKDRPIVYSLGNFVFDYFPYDPPVWKGWMAKLTFGRGTRPALDIIPVELDPAGLPHLTADGNRSATPQPSSSGSAPSARAGGRDAGIDLRGPRRQQVTRQEEGSRDQGGDHGGADHDRDQVRVLLRGDDPVRQPEQRRDGSEGQAACP